MDQQSVAIGRGARHRFGSDHLAYSWPVLDHYCRSLRFSDLLGQ
jgi:hypothetical protein